MKTLKTKIHHYRFDINKPEEKQEYKELKEKLKKDPDRQFFNVLVAFNGEKYTQPKGTIELEIEHLFSNQWNTICGHRVFDWYEGIYPNKKIKQGHWLDITEKMKTIRKDTFHCGYCGKLYYKPEHLFCNSCLGSEYLAEKDLHLLRLNPVCIHNPTYAKLTDSELKLILPQYEEKQGKARKKRIEKEKIRIKEDFKKKTEERKIEKSGQLWLLNHDYELDNVIYYSHKHNFTFGWREKVSNNEKDKILSFIKNFPYPYTIKAENETIRGE